MMKQIPPTIVNQARILPAPENNLQEPINLYSVTHESRRSMTCLHKDISYSPAARVPTSGLARTFPAGMPW
jgi:hypothetical protein